MPTPVTTLGGIVLEGETSYDWQLQYGFAPFRAIYTVTDRCAAALASQLGKPLTFRFEGPRETYEYAKIYALEILPGPNKFTRSIHLADLRWRWPYAHISAKFNQRRLTGDRFLLNDQGAPENAIDDPRQIYEPTTLRPFGAEAGSVAWTARDVVEWMLTEPSPRGLGEEAELRFVGDGVEIQDARGVFDAPGDVALEQAFGSLAGISLYVDRAGKVIVKDTRTGDGENVARSTRRGRLATGPESLEVVRAALRPSKIVHLFTVDCEVRFDFDESTTTTALATEDAPTLFNVAEVTDQSLSVAGKTLARGSIALLTDLFTAWGAFGNPSTQMSVPLLRQLFLEENGGRIENQWSVDTQGSVVPRDHDRAAAVVAAWRRLYKIAPTFFGRLESLAPVRAAILNTEEGTRAPAAVYASFIRRPRMRYLSKTQVEQRENGVRSEFDGLTIGASTIAAPFGVSVADAQVGVLYVSPRDDPRGFFDLTILGSPVGDVIPTIDGIGQANAQQVDAYANWSAIDLDSSFALAVILSVTPGTPAGLDRFYSVVTDVPGGDGPVLYSRIYPGITPARFAWADDRSEDILGAIKGTVPWIALGDLLVNEKHIDDVVAANTARILDSFRDRTVGGHDIDLNPDLEPSGTLSSVRQIMAAGATVTQLRWERDVAQVDIWRYMDASTRKALLRILHAAPNSRAP